MATQTYEQLIAGANKIKENELPESNTHDIVGEQLLQMTNKMQEESSNTTKAFTDLETDRVKKTTELNISHLYPTLGVDGSNRYTLAGAIAQVDSKYRGISGLKVTFVNNETSMPETWVFSGGTFTNTSDWIQGSGSSGNKILAWMNDVATTRKQVISKERKTLLQVRYRNSDGNVVNEQYIGTAFHDSAWSADSNWVKLPNEYDIRELDISKKYPTSGIDGTNKYTLETAVAQVPTGYRTAGLKITFINSIEDIETWEYIGPNWSYYNFAQTGAKKMFDIEAEFLHLNADNIEEKTYRISVPAEPNLTYYLFSRCTNSVAESIIAYGKDNEKLAATTQGFGTGNYYIRELTAPEGTDHIEFVFTPNKLKYTEWNMYNIPRAWTNTSSVASLYHSKMKNIDSSVGYINDNRDVILVEHTTESSSSSFFLSDFYPCNEGQSVYVETGNQAAKDVIQFYNSENVLLDKATCGGGGGFSSFTKIAPTGTALVKVGYWYSNKWKGVAKFLDYKIGEVSIKNLKDIEDIKKEQGNKISYDDIKEVFTIETDSSDIQNFVSVYTCIENTKVTVLSHHQSPIANITFCSDLFGEIVVGEPIMGDGSGGYKERSGIAPEGTRSVKIRATYKKDKPVVITKLNSPQIITYCNNKIYEIEREKEQSINIVAIDGDSTSQGLRNGFDALKLVNPQMGAIEGVQVGGETTLDTVARVGCVPFMVMPFTLEAGQTEIDVKAISQKLYKPIFDSVTGLVNTDYKWAKYKYKTGKDDSYVPYGFHNIAWGVHGTINGVKCYISFDREGDRIFKLSIEQALEENWVVSTPTPLLPENEQLRYLPTIVLMGTNAGHVVYNRQNDIYGVAGTIEWDGDVIKLSNSHDAAENLVDLYRHIRDYSYIPHKFIAVGFFCPQGLTKEFYEYYEALMNNEFGNNFFNARQYLIESGWKEAGYTLGPEDIERINRGMVPLCCFGGIGQEGNPHLTTNANRVLAYRVAQRCRELGIYNFDPVMPELEVE